MIVKMKSYDNNWRFIDNVSHFECKRAALDLAQWSSLVMDESIFGEPFSEETKNPKHVVIMNIISAGEVKNILSEFEVYLLSDNGKTIERIY